MMGMTHISFEQRRRLESLDAEAMAEHQLRKLNTLLGGILPENHFYAEKLAGCKWPLASLEEFSQWPFTYKDELSSRRKGEFAANLTFPPDHYTHFHRTSGTRGRPLVVLDSADDWQWWVDVWQHVLDVAEFAPSDRAMMAFSYGPFIGFWSAHAAAVSRGALVIPGGGLTTVARLDLIAASHTTVLFCTPTYALHMVEAAEENQINLAAMSVSRIIVAGEPGGSTSSIRKRIEEAWDARVIDHAGASEVGPWGYPDAEGTGLHIVESEFLAEFLSVETGKPATEGEAAELVLTSLGRTGSPVIRYRTGDLVRPVWSKPGPNRYVFLEGGVLGRVDDMLIVRGVNIFPGSIEHILRGFPEIVEFRMTASKDGEMDELHIEVEDRLESPPRIAQELELRLGLRIDVNCVPLGSLPRFEGKGKRFVDNR